MVQVWVCKTWDTSSNLVRLSLQNSKTVGSNPTSDSNNLIMRTNKEFADELISTFGEELAVKVITVLLIRDKQWIDKLSKDYPGDWSLTDYNKSVKMFKEVEKEILINQSHNRPPTD
jgi:hypothetical protein